MNRLFKKQKGLLIDNNLLLLCLIGRISEKLIGKKRTEKYDVEDFKALIAELSKFSQIYSTPYVLTEVYNLGNNALSDKNKEQFLVLISKLVQQVKEKYIPAKQLTITPIFSKFGLTDASIYQVCQQDNLVILTDDFPLANYAEKSKLAAINFNHIRQKIRKL